MGEPIKLSIKPLSPGERKKRRLEGLAVSLDDKDPKYFPSGDPHSVLMRATAPTDLQATERAIDLDIKDAPSDRGTPALRSDRGTEGYTEEVQPGSYGITVVPPPRDDGRTLVLRSDGVTEDLELDQESLATDQISIPLSELQWAVWQELKRMSQTYQRTCYQDLAKAINQKKRGLQRAIEALKREGAIKLVHIKSKEFQGFSVEINPSVRFHVGSKKEVYGIVKRGQTVVPRQHGLTVVPRYSEHSMYVCKKNTYIHGEDLTALLQIPPAEWKVREQTLIQVADAFPAMTALEFRLSLRRLIDQAKSGKQAIHNPNAWLKASFERNSGPLVTEREIEVRVRQQEEKIPAQVPTRRPETEAQDLEAMRRYMTANPEDRAEIDQIAEGRVRAATGNYLPT